MFGNIGAHIESLREVMSTLDLRVKYGVISDEEMDTRNKASLDMRERERVCTRICLGSSLIDFAMGMYALN